MSVVKILFERPRLRVRLKVREDRSTVECTDYRSRSGLHWDYCVLYDYDGKGPVKVTGPWSVSAEILRIAPTTTTGREGKNAVKGLSAEGFENWIIEMAEKEFLPKLAVDAPVLCKYSHDGVVCWLVRSTPVYYARYIDNQANLYVYELIPLNGDVDINAAETEVIRLGNHQIAGANLVFKDRRRIRRYNYNLEYAIVTARDDLITVDHPEHGTTAIGIPEKTLLLLAHWRVDGAPE